MIERVERAHHMYDNGPKPKHYGDDSIVDVNELNDWPTKENTSYN